MRCSVIKRKLSSGGVERQFNQEIRSIELILIDKTIKKYFIKAEENIIQFCYRYKNCFVHLTL